MQRTAEIAPKVFFGFDTGGPDSDYTAFVARMGNKIVETFAVPADLLREHSTRADSERRRAMRDYANLCQLVFHLVNSQGVALEIGMRALRLNAANWSPGQRLRGIHRQSHDDPRWLYGAMPKGQFIRLHGREAFEAIPNHLLFKRGRRRWVKRTAVSQRAWEIYQGRRRVDVVMVADGPGFFGDNVRLRAVPWAEFAAGMGFAAG